MAATKNAAKKAEQLRISQVGDFKKRLGGIFELPSGAVVKLRNPGGLQAFLANGTIPNTLLPIIQEGLKGSADNKEQAEVDIASLLESDPEILSQMMGMYNSIITKVVVEPRVYPVPTMADVEANNLRFPEAPVEDPEELRDEDRLYADEFPDEDKQFIFQWVTSGNSDLATFREGLKKGVDSLAEKQTAKPGTK